MLVALLPLGCGDYAPPIGEVSGTVTYQGKPVPGVTVNFLPDAGRPSWGLTDEDGFYVLHWDESHDGAEVGSHKVTLAFVANSPMEEAGYGTAGGPAKKKKGAAPAAASKSTPADQAAIMQKYGNFETSPLRYEVKAGSQTIDIKLD
jgi:hypothetical protein